MKHIIQAVRVLFFGDICRCLLSFFSLSHSCLEIKQWVCGEFGRLSISQLCFLGLAKTRWSVPTDLWDFLHPDFRKPHERKRRKSVASVLPGVFIHWNQEYPCPDSLPSAPSYHRTVRLRSHHLFLLSEINKNILIPGAFICEMLLCPFWTSCNMLSKQCQSTWWFWKISIPSEAAWGEKTGSENVLGPSASYIVHHSSQSITVSSYLSKSITWDCKARKACKQIHPCNFLLHSTV